MPPFLFPIHDAPDLALLAVRDEERSVRSLRDAVGARNRFVGVHQRLFAGEALREDLEVARRLLAGERLERHVARLLRQRRAIPRSVERDERAVAILRGELIARVEHHVDRREVRGEGGDRRREARAASGFLAVAAVFRIEQVFLQVVIEETVRPAEVRTLYG